MNDLPLWSARVNTHDGIHTVALTGEIDTAAAEELRHLLIEHIDVARTGIVVDLAEVTFLDSAALGALIVAYHRAEDTARSFALSNPPRIVRRILDISGVYDTLVMSGESS